MTFPAVCFTACAALAPTEDCLDEVFCNCWFSGDLLQAHLAAMRGRLMCLHGDDSETASTSTGASFLPCSVTVTGAGSPR